MLSDERIRQIAKEHYGTEATEQEIAFARAALAEAAQVPVMGGSGFDSDFIAEAKRVAESLRANGHYLAHGIITALLSSWQTEKAATSITQAELDALRKDAERYRWLSKRMVGAHFNFDDEGMCVLAFQMPGTIHISASCDHNVDMAMTLERQS